MNDMAQDLARLAPDGAEPAHGWPAAAAQVSEPAVLENLAAAGLASHAARGAAAGARGGGETGALRALCGLVAGPVYRLDPFHYAFCLRPDDVGGGLEDLAPAQWAGALEAALRRDGVELGVRSLAPPPETEGPAAGGLAAGAPVWLLRAWDAAVAAGVQAAGPDVQAVINAHFAAATARLTAELVAAERPVEPAAPVPTEAAPGEAAPGEAVSAGPAPEAAAEAAPAGAVPDAPQAVGEAAPQEAAEEIPADIPQGAPAEAVPEIMPAEAQAPLPPHGAPAGAAPEAAPPGAEAQDRPDVAALERRLAALEALLRGADRAAARPDDPARPSLLEGS